MFKVLTPQGMKKAGRFKTGLGRNVQGQHTTSYALVEKGATRPFSRILLDPTSDVDTRRARRKIYSFIDVISRLQTSHERAPRTRSRLFAPLSDTESVLGKLHRDLEETFDAYDNNRVRMSALEEQKILMQTDDYKFLCETQFDRRITEIFDSGLALNDENRCEKLSYFLIKMLPAADKDTPIDIRQAIKAHHKADTLSVECIKALAEEI